MDRNKFTFPTFLSWMYIDGQIFYSVDFLQILSLCNASCGSAEGMVVVMMMMMMVMMSRRRKRGYLRTVIFESVCKTPHLLQYSSISVYCHTVNSLFRLPHMLKVLYRSPCMSFHWRGRTVTVVKHKICHFVHECQHVSVLSLTTKRQKITTWRYFLSSTI